MRLFTFYMFNANVSVMIAHALRVCTHHAIMFTRTQGECMYQREWSRERASADEETEHKTMFGLFFTLKDFAKQLDPLGYVVEHRRMFFAPDTHHTHRL